MRKEKRARLPVVEAEWNEPRKRFEWECPKCKRQRSFVLSPTLRNPKVATCANVAGHSKGHPHKVSASWKPPGAFPKQEFPNRQVRAIADQFRDVALNMLDNVPATPLVPVLVNSSFCLELYLKCLDAKLVYHGCGIEDAFEVTSEPNTFGHDLVWLLQKLPVGIRKELNNRFRTGRTGKPRQTLRTALLPYRTLFERGRYIFQSAEHDTLKQVRLGDLRNLILFFSKFSHSSTHCET